MAQKRVIGKEAIFPTAKNQLKQSDMGQVLWEEKRKQVQLLDLPLTCCVAKGCVTGNI